MAAGGCLARPASLIMLAQALCRTMLSKRTLSMLRIRNGRRVSGSAALQQCWCFSFAAAWFTVRGAALTMRLHCHSQMVLSELPRSRGRRICCSAHRLRSWQCERNLQTVLVVHVEACEQGQMCSAIFLASRLCPRHLGDLPSEQEGVSAGFVGSERTGCRWGGQTVYKT